jgi:hypothetical protein
MSDGPMPDGPDGMDEKVDRTFLAVSFGIFLAAAVLKRSLFHDAPGYMTVPLP